MYLMQLCRVASRRRPTTMEPINKSTTRRAALTAAIGGVLGITTQDAAAIGPQQRPTKLTISAPAKMRPGAQITLSATLTSLIDGRGVSPAQIAFFLVPAGGLGSQPLGSTWTSWGTGKAILSTRLNSFINRGPIWIEAVILSTPPGFAPPVNYAQSWIE